MKPIQGLFTWPETADVDGCKIAATVRWEDGSVDIEDLTSITFHGSDGQIVAERIMEVLDELAPTWRWCLTSGADDTAADCAEARRGRF